MFKKLQLTPIRGSKKRMLLAAPAKNKNRRTLRAPCGQFVLCVSLCRTDLLSAQMFLAGCIAPCSSGDPVSFMCLPPFVSGSQKNIFLILIRIRSVFSMCSPPFCSGSQFFVRVVIVVILVVVGTPVKQHIVIDSHSNRHGSHLTFLYFRDLLLAHFTTS